MEPLDQPILTRETIFTNYGPLDMFHPPHDRLLGHVPSEDSMLLIPPPGLTCTQAFANFITNETFQALFRGFRIVGIGLPYSDDSSPPIVINRNTLPLIPSEFDFAKRIGDALQQIRMFPTIVVCVGSSIGIAQTLAFEAPVMVRSIVAIGPPPPPTRINRITNGVSNWMLRRFAGDILPDNVVENTMHDWFGSRTIERNRTRYNEFENILQNVHPSNLAIGLRLANSRRSYPTMQVRQPVLLIFGSEIPFEKRLDPFFISREDTRVEHVHMCGRLCHIESPSFVSLCIKDHLTHMNPPKVPTMSVTTRLEEAAGLIAEQRRRTAQKEKEQNLNLNTESTQTLPKLTKSFLVEPTFKATDSQELLEPASVDGFGGTTMETSRPAIDSEDFGAPGA